MCENFICRLGKEKIMYEKEVIDQGNKIEKMKEEGKDEYDIKKQVLNYLLCKICVDYPVYCKHSNKPYQLFHIINPFSRT